MVERHEEVPIRVPMLDLQAEVEELWDELNEAIQRVLRSGQFILGRELQAFEEEVAANLGVKHAIGVNSGTDALVIGLRALDIGPGDEVITTPFTFFATTEAILQVGAKPVFVDIREDSFNIDPDLIEDAITDRTKAIVPVHLFGNPAAMGKIVATARRRGLFVLEDAAQAFGATYFGDSEGDDPRLAEPLIHRKVGTIGDVGCFSFYPTKNLGAYGDAGLLVTDRDELADGVRLLRNHGASAAHRFQPQRLGYNSRMDELQAAILRAKLGYVESWTQARRRHAEGYCRAWCDANHVVLPGLTRGHAFHQFTVRVTENGRSRWKEQLDRHSVESSIFYPVLATALCGSGGATFTRAGRALSEVLSLPVHAHLQPRQVKRVRDTVAAFAFA